MGGTSVARMGDDRYGTDVLAGNWRRKRVVPASGSLRSPAVALAGYVQLPLVDEDRGCNPLDLQRSDQAVRNPLEPSQVVAVDDRTIVYRDGHAARGSGRRSAVTI